MYNFYFNSTLFVFSLNMHDSIRTLKPGIELLPCTYFYCFVLKQCPMFFAGRLRASLSPPDAPKQHKNVRCCQIHHPCRPLCGNFQFAQQFSRCTKTNLCLQLVSTSKSYLRPLSSAALTSSPAQSQQTTSTSLALVIIKNCSFLAD